MYNRFKKSVFGISNSVLRIYPVLLIIFYTNTSQAQQDGRMETDRPDQTESPFIVKKGFWQNESGFNINKRSSIRDYFLPTDLFKIGVTRQLELRYVFTLNVSEGSIKYRSEQFGFKYLITQGKGLLPMTSLIAHYHLGEIKRDLTDLNRLPHSIADIVFTSQHAVTNTFSIGYNYGIEFHNNGKHEGIFRIAPGMNIGERLYAYAEIFGRFPIAKYDDTWLDGGIAYYINNDLKLDMSTGKSLRFRGDYYFAIGVSTRASLFSRK